jgi:hypothetical protein
LTFPTLALVIACLQIREATTGPLSSWKGGGFGMFARLDSPIDRKVVVRAVENGTGASYLVRLDPTGSSPLSHPLGSRGLLAAATHPTPARLSAIAEAVARRRLLKTSEISDTMSGHLPRSPYRAVLASTVGLLRFAEISDAPTTQDSLLHCLSIHVRVVGFCLEPSSRQLKVRTVAGEVAASCGAFLNP